MKSRKLNSFVVAIYFLYKNDFHATNSSFHSIGNIYIVEVIKQAHVCSEVTKVPTLGEHITCSKGQNRQSHGESDNSEGELGKAMKGQEAWEQGRLPGAF